MPKKAPKKPVKTAKTMPKTAKGEECSTKGFCICKTILAVIIIILVWVSMATWSRVIITIAAVLVIVLAGCPCKKNKEKL